MFHHPRYKQQVGRKERLQSWLCEEEKSDLLQNGSHFFSDRDTKVKYEHKLGRKIYFRSVYNTQGVSKKFDLWTIQAIFFKQGIKVVARSELQLTLGLGWLCGRVAVIMQVCLRAYNVCAQADYVCTQADNVCTRITLSSGRYLDNNGSLQPKVIFY